jgi:outer membrane protein
MMKHILFIGAMLVMVTLNSYAQQASPTNNPGNKFTVADCVNYALQHQDSVINAGLDIKSADYKIKETIGSGLPQVNGSVSFQDFLKAPTTVGPNLAGLINGGTIDPNAPLVPFPFGAVKYNNTYSLTASQLLFSGTFLVGLQAVKTYKELYTRSLTRSKIQATVNVTKAYYQVLVSNEQIKLLDANIAQLKQQLDQTTQQNKQGFVEKIDVDRLSVQYNNLTTNRANIQRSLILNYEMLKFQMGMPIQQEITLVDKLGDVNLEQQVSIAQADTSAYHNRIEYSLLETNVKLNQLDVKAKKAAFLPTVTANAGFGEVFQENQFKYLYSHTYPDSYIGLNINVPIFNGNQRKNQLRESEINVEKAKNDLNNAKNGLSLEVSAAGIMFYNSLQSLNTQKRSRELAQEVLRVSNIKYTQGVGSSIEVTQAQTELETADNQYIQALYNALISKVDLDKAYGRIK